MSDCADDSALYDNIIVRYISTRGQAPPVSFLDAVLAGMAPDGGLYVPESWPELERSQPSLAHGHYVGAVMHTLAAFGGEDIGWNEPKLTTICNEAYIAAPKSPEDAAWRPKWPEAVTPLRQTGCGTWRLELFHGPSLSFKDVAMQLIGPLYELALTRRDTRLSVVCATSGDTGGAAAEALKGRERIDLFVLTPKGRVSDAQRRFMTTSGAANVYALEIDGDFDACQGIVKALFADKDFAARAQLSGVNSINWARIVAQSVYFQMAASILGVHGPANFIVPTGNFGDAYSGWVAKRLGAPIGKLGIATNANDILVRALDTGMYKRAANSHATLSPAMDIQVASNFERILFEVMDRDGEAVAALYARLQEVGSFMIPKPALERLRDDFSAAAVNDEETLEMMGTTWTYNGELICPHTAVGESARGVTSGAAPMIFLATAHPAKFPDTVERATGVRPQLPKRCADLYERAERFDTLPTDVDAVKRYIRDRSRAWN